ncbi:MAG: hypothetical protein IJQ81_09295, partial [Oscillibacter sp.]|nr:hypothetical protein [Oscillibacter sp.]
VDALAGVESRQRLAAGVNEELVRNACAMSYGKSVQNVTGNRVFRQTVMNKVRESHVPLSLGLPAPAQAVSLPARSGKVTPLFNALRPF